MAKPEYAHQAERAIDQRTRSRLLLHTERDSKRDKGLVKAGTLSNTQFPGILNLQQTIRQDERRILQPKGLGCCTSGDGHGNCSDVPHLPCKRDQLACAGHVSGSQARMQTSRGVEKARRHVVDACHSVLRFSFRQPAHYHISVCSFSRNCPKMGRTVSVQPHARTASECTARGCVLPSCRNYCAQ